MKASAFLTMKLFFRREQKKRDEHGAPNDQHHRSTNRCPDIASCARALGVIGSLRLTGKGHKSFNPMYEWTMNCSDGGTHAKPKSYLCKLRMAANFVSRYSGSTVSDCRWRYKQSTVLETGIVKLSRSTYMPSMMKMSLLASFGHDCLAPTPL